MLEWKSGGWKERKSCVSSVYRWWFKERDETRVLSGVVYMTKRRGPKTEPWGTPQRQVCDEEKSLLHFKTCRQAKLIIQGHSSGRTGELLRLPRQKLTLATGILTGHSQLNRHLSVMGITSDPTCNYCEEGLETAAHFLCECSHFVTQRQEIWGKSNLHPSEADSVQNLVRFILKSQILITF